jgi:hypothetical protein
LTAEISQKWFDHRHRAKPLLTDFCTQKWF